MKRPSDDGVGAIRAKTRPAICECWLVGWLVGWKVEIKFRANYSHQELGIAWHKAGILKPGVPAFSASQQPEVASVLQARAVEKGVQLEFVRPLSSLPVDAPALRPEVLSDVRSCDH